MKIKTYIVSIAIITFCFAMGLIVFGYALTVKDKENRLLRDDVNRLELDLAERENEIYELSLEIASTNRTLADTAFALDNAILELEEAKKAGDILHLDYVGTFNCTAYCCEKYPHICGTGSGKTASGAPVTADVSVAVGDLEMFPYGTIIYIEDVGIRIVQDTGSFNPSKIDVAVDTHKHASNWEGQGRHKVYIISIPKGE